MWKDFLLKKMLASQMKNVPKEYRDKILEAVTKNPELFAKIAAEAQQKMKEGKGQTEALQEVVKNYESELKNTLAL